MDDQAKQVKELIKKASAATSASDALHYSQAACNAANAMCALKNALDA